MRILAGFLTVLFIATVAAAQSTTRSADVLTPGDNLVVQGIPPIPRSLVESVGRYTEFRAASPLSWHPTRREMLITTRFADTYQVHLVRSPLGMRKQLTFFKENVRSAAYENSVYGNPTAQTAS